MKPACLAISIEFLKLENVDDLSRMKVMKSKQDLSYCHHQAIRRHDVGFQLCQLVRLLFFLQANAIQLLEKCKYITISYFYENTCILNKCGIQLELLFSQSPYCISRTSGPWFNIKMSSYQYRKSHCGDKMNLLPSYLNNGIFILVSPHLYIESGPWIFPQQSKSKLFSACN